MRFKLPALAFLALALPVGAMSALSACGSTTDDTLTDASKDSTTTDVALDVAPDVAPEAGCANDADLTKYLPGADASIDVDSGSFAIGACINCLETQCGTDINACNSDCACRQGVIDAVTCVEQGTDFQTCGENALFSGNTDLSNLFGCALQQCEKLCIGGDGGLPSDASAKDATVD